VVRWLAGQQDAIHWLNEHPAEAKKAFNAALVELTTRDMAAEVLDEAWSRLAFTSELLPDAFAKLAKDAAALGYLPSHDVSGIFAAGLVEEAGGDPAR